MDPSLSSAAYRLPRDTRIIASARDYLVARLPYSTFGQQVAVIWDPGRDELVLDCLTSLRYRDAKVCLDVIALSMVRGKLSVYFATNEQLSWVRSQVQAACDAALEPVGGHWDVLPVVAVPMTTSGKGNPILDWDRLPAEHPLHAVSGRYQLGVV